MHLSIYIHDFHPQIGHARAMIELLNGLNQEQKKIIESIEIVSFTASPYEEVFKSYSCPKKFTQIPFPNLKPFLIKMIFYHIVTFIHSLTCGRGKVKIGVGVASLNVDIVNVQFVHEQWREHFFKNRNLSLTSLAYKKILFSYFYLAEKITYSLASKIKYIVIANFIKNYLHENFNTPLNAMTLIPSGVNSQEFSLVSLSNDELFKNLIQAYPNLKTLDINKPIALFIGAFERKGLSKVLKTLEFIPEAQLIIIGKSEEANFKIPQHNFKIVHIPFTKEVRLFYQLADTFIFPTMYEPFGLVIIEAYAMGLDLIIPIEDVGASEIIPEGEGIQFFHQNEHINLTQLTKLTIEIKKRRREERLNSIKEFNWENNSNEFYKLLTQ